MKKIRYYAPYWITALIVITLILAAVLYHNRPLITLYEYAVSLDDSDLFVKYDGTVWKASSTTKSGILIEPTDIRAHNAVDIRTSTDFDELLPYEYDGFIRQDGTVWYLSQLSISSRVILEPYLPLDEELHIKDEELLLSAYALSTSLHLIVQNQSSEPILYPVCYLYAQMADGKYYPIFADYTQYQRRTGVSADTSVSFGIPLPREGSDFYTGSYRVLIYSDTPNHYDGGKYPLHDAELIATVDFDIVKTISKNSKYYEYDLVNLSSSVDDFIAS